MTLKGSLMPFKQVGEATVWTNPSPEEIRSATDFKNTEKEVIALPPDIQKVLQRFTENANIIGTKLSSSNSKYYSGLEQISKDARLDAVDIIVPVYNSLHVVKECLRSVIERTIWPYRLIIVNDQSDEKTTEYLNLFQKEYPQHLVIHNTKNRGFAATVNRGLLAGSNPYICLLNSDVIVTPRWLMKMVMAFKANPKNQIVNPVTNNTALINVEMAPGYSYMDMNRSLEAQSSHDYPEIMPTGFCFMFPRSLIHKIGIFDEAYGSYGEETDFWMKTLTYQSVDEYPRYRSVLADDTYIFHERGTSFSQLGNDAHMGQRQTSSDRFKRLWPGFKDWSANYNTGKALDPIKQIVSMPPTPVKYEYNVCWVVYSTAFCGGMKYIVDVVNFLIERGVNAKVVRILRSKDSERLVCGDLRTAPIVFNSVEDFVDNFSNKVFSTGTVIASTCELVDAVDRLTTGNDKLTPILHAQSYDPVLAPDEETKQEMMAAFSKMPVISNAWWLDEIAKNKHGAKSFGFVRPGVDLSLFYPRDRAKGDERKTVLFCMNTSYPFKGAERAKKVMQVLWNKAAKKNMEIRILAYGVDTLPDVSVANCLGSLSQSRLAQVLGREVDILVDPAHTHSYGMPALEAMASGAVPACFDNTGIHEYAVNNENSIIVPNDADPEQLAVEIFSTLFNDAKLNKMKESAVAAAQRQPRSESINVFVSLLEKELHLTYPKRRIVMVTPHLRKHGGPTTILNIANALKDYGHNVSLISVYADVNPEVMEMCNVPLSLNYENVPECDVLISNSDNPFNDMFVKSPNAKKKIMLKLSHNQRFQELESKSLALNWDKIVTSSQWLANICETPDPENGWNYPPKKATRIGWNHYGHAQFDCAPQNKPLRNIETGLVIGTLVHQHPLKGSKIALKALEIIKAKYNEKIHVVAVGEVPDFTPPPWMQYFNKLNRVQMASTMRQTDIWVGASYTEGLGRIALEAMSSRCTVILSDTGAEFAENGKNCLLYPPGDVDALVAAIETLIADSTLSRVIANAGYATATSHSDISPVINNLNKVITEVYDGVV